MGRLDKDEIAYIAEEIAKTLIPFSGMFLCIQNMDERGAEYVYDRACDLGFDPDPDDDPYKIMGMMQTIFNTW